MTVVLARPGNSTGGWAEPCFNDAGEGHCKWGMPLALARWCPYVPACASQVVRKPKLALTRTSVPEEDPN